MTGQATAYDQAKDAFRRAGDFAKTPTQQFELARSFLPGNEEAIRHLNIAEENLTYCRFRRILIAAGARV